jgi:hypothetical protein
MSRSVALLLSGAAGCCRQDPTPEPGARYEHTHPLPSLPFLVYRIWRCRIQEQPARITRHVHSPQSLAAGSTFRAGQGIPSGPRKKTSARIARRAP